MRSDSRARRSPPKRQGSKRNPRVALKQLTTLDFLSGGRVVTAVAAGWMEGELDLLGAGCDGLVVGLDHVSPGLEERIARFARRSRRFWDASGGSSAPAGR